VPIGGEPQQEFVAYGKEFVPDPVGGLFQTDAWNLMECMLCG
jgi:hypothetical protein